MAKGEEIPKTNRAEIEILIERVKQHKLEPRDVELIERLLRTVVSLVELLQRKNTSIKKLRELIFGKRTERHQARQAEDQEKRDESGKADDGPSQAASNQATKAERSAGASEEKPSRKGHGRRAASDYSGAKVVKCQHAHLKVGDHCPSPLRRRAALRSERADGAVAIHGTAVDHGDQLRTGSAALREMSGAI
jgi:hypothetical protein